MSGPNKNRSGSIMYSSLLLGCFPYENSVKRRTTKKHYTCDQVRKIRSFTETATSQTVFWLRRKKRFSPKIGNLSSYHVEFTRPCCTWKVCSERNFPRQKFLAGKGDTGKEKKSWMRSKSFTTSYFFYLKDLQ